MSLLPLNYLKNLYQNIKFNKSKTNSLIKTRVNSLIVLSLHANLYHKCV